MASGYFVGQAVITDPFGSGFQMRAVSESVAPEDRVFLLEMPHVSNYLLLLQEPGRYLSFQRLPSGSWALGHRFVHGQRRAGLNRVVDHILIVPGALLEAVLGDAWLLIAGCRFHAGGEWRLFTELSELVGEPEVREVPDLEVEIPDDPGTLRFDMIEKRSEFLKRSLESEEALCGALAQILGAVEAGCGVLLPQEPVMEQLLALAWSVLPLKDRLRIPWTTHLGGGGGAVFRLALNPAPELTRYQQGDPERWVLLGEPAKSPAGGGEALAEVIVSRFDLFPQVEAGLPGFEPSLSRPGEMRDWVDWVKVGGKVPSQGFATAEELAALLDLHDSRGARELRRPWLDRGALLRCAALTVFRRSETAKSWSAAVQEVAEALGTRKLAWGLLDPDQIVEMIRQGTNAHEAQAALGALALFLASPERREHSPSLESFLEALEARSSGGSALAPLAGLEAVPVFSDLAALIFQLRPEKAEIAYRVAQRNGGLAMALARFTPPLHLGHLVHLRALLRVAQEAGDGALAGRIAQDFLVPLLARYPSQAKVEELGKQVLEALRAAPEGLVQAFAEWKNGDLYDAAARTLRSWAEERMVEARTVAERLASEIHSETPDLVRERPSVLGIAGALAAAGAPPRHWLVFALAEAALLDTTRDQMELRSFRGFLSKAKVESPGIEEPLKKLLARFHRVSSGPPLGPAHQALVTCLAGPLGQHPTQTAAALAQLTRIPTDDLLLWGEAVYAVAAAVSATDPKSSSQIARNWWTGLTVATLRLDAFPAGALQMLGLLSAQDAAAVLDRWTLRFSDLGQQPGLQALVESFEALARRHALTDQEFRCGVGRLVWKLRHEGGDLAEAVEETVRNAALFSQSEVQVASALARLFPANPPEGARAVMGLLVSPRLHPQAKALIEKRFLERVLSIPMLSGALPSVEDLARHTGLLFRVSESMGRNWRKYPEEATTFVRRLVNLERYDAVGAFLRGSEDSGERGFIQYLEAQEPSLYEALRQAAKHPVGRWDLARVKELKTQGSD